VRALSSDAAWEILGGLTRGPIRYRIEWASAGRRRAATLRVAARVAAARPALVNDPRDAPWEVVVTERSGKSGSRIFVELWPRGLDDPRFAYRRRVLPASSHPTLAAALARFAGVRSDDVVWDPFAGAGGELVERGLLGPYLRLHGFDTDDRAIAAARENLTAARLDRWKIEKGDARRDGPAETPTLLISNPPFGKRIKSDGSVPELLDAVLGNAARRLAPKGRVVWISPVADRTARAADRHGFNVERRQPVDGGGIPAEIQVFTLGTMRRR
jgi:23S rRNA G2445 N2-methylase RlmL